MERIIRDWCIANKSDYILTFTSKGKWVVKIIDKNLCEQGVGSGVSVSKAISEAYGQLKLRILKGEASE